MLRTIRRPSAAVIAIATGLCLAACADGARSVAAPGTTTPTAPARSSAPAPAPAASCQDDPPPAAVARQTGSAITATVTRQSGPSSQWNLALPQATAKRVPELLEDRLPDDFDGVFNRAYDQGRAFTYGGMRLSLDLENDSGHAVTVTDIRPANIRAVCPPTGLLVLYGSEGGDFISMTVNLDAARPIVHERSTDGNVSVDPYFADHSIRLPVGGNQGVDLDIEVAKRAYVFDLAVTYVDRGQVRTQIVNRGGVPFRATASTCPSTADRATLSAADEQRLRGQRFGRIQRRADGTDANLNYIVEQIDNQRYQTDCDTW